MLKFLFLFAFISVLGLETESATTRLFQPLHPTEGYTHHLIVNEDKPEQYQLFWKKLNDEELQYEIHCKTTGWVGMGFSRNGGMGGSDIAIGWVKDGQAYIKDCYANGRTTPQTDLQQDFILLDGAETDGYTILKFKRKLITCDKKDDIEIKAGTQFMIFAWNDADPLTGNNDWKYHGATNRIPRTTLLLSYKDETLDQQGVLPSDVYTYSMRFDNLQIPAKSTYYFCDVFALPKFSKPTHFIQFEMMVNPKNKQNVHHLLAYECDDDYAMSGPVAQECGRKSLPSTVANKCMKKMIVAWGIGGQYNYSFPKQAGYRFEASTKAKYILIEIHYDNPKLLTDMVDDSGLKLYFTEQLRQYDLGLLMLGADGSSMSLQIPPKSSHSTFTSICYPECTERFFPQDGIYAISGFLHTHLAGRAVKTTLVRNGVAIRELFENPNYDFNYQFSIDIEPTKLYKGDSLITKCSYDTNDRNDFTFFGFSTYDEMCFDFIYYYPKIPQLVQCHSSAPQDVLFQFYTSLIKEGLIPNLNIMQLASLSQSQIMNVFQTSITPTPRLVQRFEEFFGGSYNKTVVCGSGNTYLYKPNVPDFVPIRSEIVSENSCGNN